MDDPKSNGFPFELKSADFGRKKGKEEHTVPNKEEDLKILKRGQKGDPILSNMNSIWFITSTLKENCQSNHCWIEEKKN